jgi:hypothetical protein
MEGRNMKKVFGLIISTALIAGFALTADAKSEKKKVPKDDVVEAALTEAGPAHFPEKMKIDKTGPVKVEDTYFHAFCGSLKKGGYRVIIFDNKENYLGYYESEYEPSETGPGEVLIDSGDGETYYKFKIGKDGPKKKANIDGTSVAFVKNKQLEKKKEAEAAAEAAEAVANEPIQPEYREWVLSHNGKKIPVEAIYVKQNSNKVTLKKKSDGRSKEFPLSKLSAADQEYVKKLK